MKNKINIENWSVEDSGFWEKTGKKLAKKNLLISIPNLLLGFAVWIMWSIIAAQLRDHGFHFGLISDGMSQDEMSETWSHIRILYWTLPAIAGLSGATLRIPHSFLISLAGGRNVIFTTSALLIIPAVIAGFAMQNVATPYLIFAIAALISGVGGGAFSSSMSNISYFFPKKKQGLALGLNAGIGNLGVGFAQFIIPIVAGVALFSATDLNGQAANDALAGIQNGAWFWVPLLLIFSVAAFLGMNNLKIATPSLPGTFRGVGNTLYLTFLGLISAGIGAWLITGLNWNIWIVLPGTIILTLLLLKFGSPAAIRKDLDNQFKIFDHKHTWIMTVIYVMTFGSYIGYSSAFPMLSQELFVYTDPNDSDFMNPNAPNYMLWAFVGPMIGALVRPVGGWLSDKIGSGSRVTNWITILQIGAALGLAFIVTQVNNHETPELYWWPYFGLFMILFIATGIGNGSTFRSIPNIFDKKSTGPVLGWTAAIAAYGAFLIPRIFGEQIELGHAEYALYGFAVYYVVCLMLNWWYYLGPKREYQKP